MNHPREMLRQADRAGGDGEQHRPMSRYEKDEWRASNYRHPLMWEPDTNQRGWRLCATTKRVLDTHGGGWRRWKVRPFRLMATMKILNPQRTPREVEQLSCRDRRYEVWNLERVSGRRRHAPNKRGGGVY